MFTLILLAGTSLGASRHSLRIEQLGLRLYPTQSQAEGGILVNEPVTHHANVGHESVRRARVCAKSLPLCPTPPGSSVHGILQTRTEVGCHALLQGIVPTQGSNPRLLCLLQSGRLLMTSTTGEAPRKGFCE